MKNINNNVKITILYLFFYLSRKIENNFKKEKKFDRTWKE